MPRIDDATLTQWETCTYRMLRAAAAITRHAQDQQPRTRIAANSQLAAELDVSTATVIRAKRFLAAKGIIAKGGNNRYYTPGAPQRVADALTRRLAGQPPGTPVPSDVNLAAEYGVSFATAGKAKKALAAQGIITKDNGSNRYRTA